MTNQFGEFKSVPVRNYWQHEAADFTPWLARPENIGRLADALGIELEVENTEVAVGPYAADIVAKDTGTGRYVIIENLLGKTDHDHLGKLITYAAALDAETLVLIATDFTEEHQKALDWLNEHSSDDLGFFGVRLELWQIDDSKPAIRFTVVSQPTTPTRQAAKASASEELTPTRRLQLEFWTEFEKRLRDSKQVPSTQSPRPQYWYNVALGRSGIHLSCTADTYENKIGIRVYLQSSVAERALEQLLKQRDAIEREIGAALQWNPHPDKSDKIILLSRAADLSVRDNWEEYLAWLVECTLKMRKAFGSRVKSLVIA